MHKVEIIKTSGRTYDVYIDGVKQKRVVDIKQWFDNSDRRMKFRIETHTDNGETYAQVFSDFELVYRSGKVSNVTATLIDQLQERDAKGRQKYGTTLDRKDLSLADWLQHQTEELLDAAGYAQAAKREVERLLQIEKLAHELLNTVKPTHCSETVRNILRQLNQALLP